MRLTVFGANGKVGSLVVKAALSRGHEVVAFVHSSAPAAADRLTILRGDIYNKADVDKAISGSDVVISALSSWGTPKKDVLSAAMEHIIPAMEAARIQRIVSLTGNVALAPGDTPSAFMKMARMGMRLAAARIIDDGEQHIALLATSTLNWSVVRSPVMTTMGSTDYKLTLEPSMAPTIHRQAVADSLLALAEGESWSRQAPIICRS